MKKAAISTRPKSKKMFSKERETALGICLCCNLFRACTYPKDPERPILQCEEFDGNAPSSLKRVPHGKIVPENLRKTPRVSAASPYRGLCSLCEDRVTCTYPKLEGGVWHCKEYR
jgi:hypothetical protein